MIARTARITGVRALLLVYALGVVVGLLRVDASPAKRLLVAASSPPGVAAGVVTITGLLLATLVLFPIVGAVCVAAGAVIWMVTAANW